MFVCPECGLAQGQAGHCPADGTALLAQTDDPIVGTTLGPYRIARLLGVGGMGRVYKAVHPGIGSRVAIKVLSYECAQRQDLVERFFSEARAVNLIRHESIVNVLDLAMLPDGRPYIIMEYLDGAPLADLVTKAGPLPLGSLARLAAEVLDALGAAHAKGIVHRDLKPDNIYVTPAGHPKVLDFGIAKLQQNMGAGSATQTGSLLGTPHYMSPEQAMGRNVDLRTDIYAMGVILFECATGRRPFHSDSLYDLLRQHVEQTPPSPRSLRPDMPVLFEQVILASLAKDPAQRPQSAAALSQALQQATQGMGPEAWVPVTPGTASQIAAQRTPHSWGPTQPSWPGGSAPGATPVPPTDPGAGRSAPMGGYPGTPVPGPGMMPSAPGTMSSGQMVPKSSSGSGKGLWIGLFALAVVAGGGSAIYFATRDSGASAPAVVAQNDPTPTPGPDPAKPADPTPTPAPAPAPAPTPPPTAASDDSAEDHADKVADQIDNTLDQKVENDTDNAVVPKGSSAGATANIASAVPSATSFTSSSPLPLPPGWDPKAFDVSGYFPTAEAAAKAIWPDAKLVRFDADGVRPNGLAELTLDDDYYVRYWFKSDKESKPPPDQVIGAKFKGTCNLQVWVSKDGIDIQPMDWDCDEIEIPPPKCTVKQAWEKAIKTGAPGGNAVAEIGYMANIVSKEIRWFVQVGDAYDEQLPDGC